MTARELLTVEDLAVELQVGERAVRKMLSTGALPGLRIGRRWYVRREALLAKFRAAENARASRRRRDEADVERVVRALRPHRTDLKLK